MFRSTAIMTIWLILGTSPLLAQERDRRADRDDRRDVEVERRVESDQTERRGRQTEEQFLDMIERAYNQEDEGSSAQRRRSVESDELANALKRVLVSRDMINPDDTLAINIENKDGQIRIVIEAATTRDRPQRDAARRDRPRGETEERRVERRRESRSESSTQESQSRRDDAPDGPRTDRRRNVEVESDARPSRSQTRELEDILRRLQRLERPGPSFRSDSRREIDAINRRLQRLEQQLNELSRSSNRRDR
ncbi:MAG: hypothetical protein ACR2NP_16060 [Pirellulaceae bacterium]